MRYPAPWDDKHARAATRGLDLVTRLNCQARGCRESLAVIDVDFRLDPENPRLRLAIRAGVLFAGKAMTDFEPVYLAPGSWRRRSRLEFTCRAGHASSFGAGHLVARLRGRAIVGATQSP